MFQALHLLFQVFCVAIFIVIIAVYIIFVS